jgi:apolipoprotein N-acyltransferase
VRVAAIQPNVAQAEKFSAESEDRILERLGSLTALAASTRPDLILWPEAATPRGMYADQINYRFVRDQTARGDFAFLIGTVDFDPERREEFNVAVLLTNRGETIQPYRKIHLVPFGEYMPLRHSFPLFAMVAGELVPGDFSAGGDFTVMDLPKPGVRLSALICFEDTLGDLTRRFVQNGAQLLVNLTNDGWFLTSAAAEQHVANAVFRAVENRRPLLRCTNTGVTCAVDVHGRVVRWLPPFLRGFVTREIVVPRGNRLTFYTRHGDWFVWITVLATALQLFSQLFRRRVPRP